MRFPEFEDEWEKKKFSKYIKLFRGSSPRPIVKFITKDENGVNWIKIGDTKNTDNSIINNVEEKITIEGARKSRKVTNGELILANSMSFGKTYQLSIDGYIYDGWFVLREYENYFEKSFLLQLLNSDYLQKQYKRLSAGGVVQNISSEIVYETILIRPSLQEQKKISSFLSLIDENITTQRKTIEELNTLKKGIAQKIFSQQLRFKDDNRNDFPEWKEIDLENVCEIKKGEQFNKEELDETGLYPCLNGGVSPSGFSEKYNTDENTITISEGGNSCGFVNFMTTKFWLGGHCYKILLSQNINLLYFYQILKYNEQKIMSLRVGSGLPNIQLKDLKKLKIKISLAESEQQKITNFLSSIDSKIDIENRILQKLEEQKKYFLANLFI
mgnify:FL=1